MKRTILTLALLSILGLTATSCSTDDSALESTNKSADFGISPGDGTKDLPRPTLPR